MRRCLDAISPCALGAIERAVSLGDESFRERLVIMRARLRTCRGKTYGQGHRHVRAAVHTYRRRTHALMYALGQFHRVPHLCAGQQDRKFICIEPMAGITDAVNLAQKGRYSELQSIPAGGTWQESFWIRPSGF